MSAPGHSRLEDLQALCAGGLPIGVAVLNLSLAINHRPGRYMAI